MCGSKKHGFLKKSHDQDQEHPAQVNCPVTVYERGEETLGNASALQDYDLCKHALANSINYEVSDIPQVLRDYTRYGRGQLQTREALDMFRKTLIQICETYHLPKLPKRKIGGSNVNDGTEGSKRSRITEC